jgi:precorrin-6B methylase 2
LVIGGKGGASKSLQVFVEDLDTDDAIVAGFVQFHRQGMMLGTAERHGRNAKLVRHYEDSQWEGGRWVGGECCIWQLPKGAQGHAQ